MAKQSIFELTRLNMNLPTSVVDRVKDYADNLGINVTSAYIVLLNQALDQKSTLDILPIMLQAINEANNTNIEKDNSILSQKGEYFI